MNFSEFFTAVYENDEDGKPITPFPWQSRLAKEVQETGWRSVLDLPTASGKTSAIDVAVFHLIQQLADIRDDKRAERTAPLRIFFIVDRRIVVDGAFRHAEHLARMLQDATDGPLKEAADLLRNHFAVDQPLQVSLMRGGMYRDNGWTASPVQPTVCVSTVDQVGSRLLFRGYGVTPSMRPIHAGLVANDSLLLVDEAHLSEPFLQTLDAVKLFSSERFAERPTARPFRVVQMSATNADASESTDVPFQIDDEDRADLVLGPRFKASKIARLEKIKVDKDDAHIADDQFASAIVTRAIALSELRSSPTSPKRKTKKKENAADAFLPARVIGIVVNRVRTARLIFDKLRRRPEFRDPLSETAGEPLGEKCSELAETILLTGRMRPWDRDELLFRKTVGGKKEGWLPWLQSGRTEPPHSAVFVVATQTVEVGADIDFDALITEVAPLDCLRQRFGRLDRRGYRKRSQALIVARNVDVAKTSNDRVYGDRLTRTWQWIEKNLEGKGKNGTMDFGIAAMDETLKNANLSELCAVHENAPILLPPYIDLWVRTNPAPAADPDVVPFLHGPGKTPADVQVVWRADLLSGGEERFNPVREKDYIDAIVKLPPSSMEACSMPIYEVQRWLRAIQDEPSGDIISSNIGDIADVEGDVAVENATRGRRSRGTLVVLWKGEEKSTLGNADNIRPGDTVIVPTSFGGHDPFGWQPDSAEVKDVAEGCSRWNRARPVVRIHPNLLTKSQWGTASFESIPGDDEKIVEFLGKLLELNTLPDAVRRSCSEVLTEPSWNIPYERDDRITAWLVVKKQRLKREQVLRETRGELDGDFDVDLLPDNDEQSSFTGSGVRISLDQHTNGVVKHVKQFSRLVELDKAIASDLNIVAQWHDIGKIDERFQTLLHDGDYTEAVVALSSGLPLAKSGQTHRDRSARARARLAAGVPNGFRHETLSVLLLRYSNLAQILEKANDRDLVEYLSGSHHGNGRASHGIVLRDDRRDVDRPPSIKTNWHSCEITLDSETQIEKALYRLGVGWEDLFVRMNHRYGYWGLAWLEAIFRLADHCQSAIDAIACDESQEAAQI